FLPVLRLHISHTAAVWFMKFVRIGIQNIRLSLFATVRLYIFVPAAAAPGIVSLTAVALGIINLNPGLYVIDINIKGHAFASVFYGLRFHPDTGSHKIVPLEHRGHPI